MTKTYAKICEINHTCAVLTATILIDIYGVYRPIAVVVLYRLPVIIIFSI